MVEIDMPNIKDALIGFGEKIGKLNFKKEEYFTPNAEAAKLIWDNHLVSQQVSF